MFSGLRRLRSNIFEMIQQTTNIYWRICWKVVSPIFLLVRSFISHLQSVHRLPCSIYYSKDCTQLCNLEMALFQVIIGLQVFSPSTFSIKMYDDREYEYPANAVAIGNTSNTNQSCLMNSAVGNST